ncbi:putative accessory protein [Chrysanthemum yellow dwarf virus]|uniref:Accessory protein n=1 Tax=chrysanthemum yellow dwarf associated virus TaxID=3070829 RepID=A0AAE7QHQ3_9RHAB|nr:putative accessory protein [Chrysanthemum yellow dwarf virus]QRX38976.1 putative accessory protein [Chrysanthemum yellow dwarf virus]
MFCDSVNYFDIPARLYCALLPNLSPALVKWLILITTIYQILSWISLLFRWLGVTLIGMRILWRMMFLLMATFWRVTSCIMRTIRKMGVEMNILLIMMTMTLWGTLLMRHWKC